jgi:V8-like Glu-specific endopeptidase
MAAVAHGVRASLTILGLVAASGCGTLQSTPSQRLTSTEKMVWSTYAIGTRHGLATCIVVKRSGSAGRNFFPVLITSAHVLSVAPHGPFFIAARVPDDNGSSSVALLEFQPSSSSEPAYVRHPQYDVAAIELPIPSEIAAQLSFPSFVSEKAIGTAADTPHVGDEVSVLGFPQVFPGTKGGFPVLRAGRIASYTDRPRSESGKFLLNTNVYPGDSGGPVFAAHRRGGPHLLGIVAERIGPRGGSVPLAVAIDARVIRETLALLNAREGSLAAIASARKNLTPAKELPPTVKLLGSPPSWMHDACREMRAASRP